MRVLLLAVLLSAASPIGESGGESILNVCRHRQGAAAVGLVSGDSPSVPVDCPGKGALPAIGASGPMNGLALTHCAVVGSNKR